MSSDNYLVSVPAKDGRIGLYEVSASDSRICRDDPDHVLCPAVLAHALSCLGTYNNDQDLALAIERAYEERVIEYPPEIRHKRSSPRTRRSP